MIQSAIYLALLCLVALFKTDHAEVPVQEGELSCYTNVEDMTMTANLHIKKNTSNINRVFFISPNVNSEYTDAECLWTGTGMDNDPFTASVTVNTATAQSTGYDCGTIWIQETGMYQWTAYAESEAGFTWDAVVFTFECNGLPDEVSTIINISKPGVLLTQSQYGILDFGFYFTNAALQHYIQADPGYQYRLGLEFTPDNSQENSLGAWGAFCEELYVTPTPDRTYRRLDLINRYNGCPYEGQGPHHLSSPFVGQYPTVNTLYRSMTGYAESFRFDRSSDYRTDEFDMLYFVCEAQLCWRPNDIMCLNRCPSNPGRRRRDDVKSTYTLMANITLNNPKIQKDEPSEANNYMIPLLASVGGFVLLLAVILVVAFLCCRGRSSERYRHHQDSYSSSNGSDRHQSSGKSSMMEKRSRDYSNYPIRY